MKLVVPTHIVLKTLYKLNSLFIINSKNCEGTPFSNVQGNEAEMCDGRLKGK